MYTVTCYRFLYRELGKEAIVIRGTMREQTAEISMRSFSKNTSRYSFTHFYLNARGS